MPTPTLTVAEAAAMLGITPRQVRRHITQGTLPAIKLGWGSEPPGTGRNTFRYRLAQRDVLALKARMPLPVGWDAYHQNRKAELTG